MRWTVILAIFILIGCGSEPDQSCKDAYDYHSDRLDRKIERMAHESQAREVVIDWTSTTWDCEDDLITITRDFCLQYWNGPRHFTGIYRALAGGGSSFEIEESIVDLVE